MNITRDRANAIAASAYNVCGPQRGDFATPSNVWTFGAPVVLDAMERYAEHAADPDSDALYTQAEVIEARRLHIAG